MVVSLISIEHFKYGEFNLLFIFVIEPPRSQSGCEQWKICTPDSPALVVSGRGFCNLVSRWLEYTQSPGLEINGLNYWLIEYMMNVIIHKLRVKLKAMKFVYCCH